MTDLVAVHNVTVVSKLDNSDCAVKKSRKATHKTTNQAADKAENVNVGVSISASESVPEKMPDFELNATAQALYLERKERERVRDFPLFQKLTQFQHLYQIAEAIKEARFDIHQVFSLSCNNKQTNLLAFLPNTANNEQILYCSAHQYALILGLIMNLDKGTPSNELQQAFEQYIQAHSPFISTTETKRGNRNTATAKKTDDNGMKENNALFLLLDGQYQEFIDTLTFDVDIDRVLVAVSPEKVLLHTSIRQFILLYLPQDNAEVYASIQAAVQKWDNTKSEYIQAAVNQSDGKSDNKSNAKK